MKHYPVITLIFLLFCQRLKAQQDRDHIVVSLHPDSSITDTTSLHYIGTVLLEANTPDTSVIGYTSDTSSYTTYSLVPQTQLTNWVQTYVDAAYNSLFSSSGASVHWLIKNMSLSESSSTSSVYIHLQTSIYSGASGNPRFYQELDTLLTYPHTPGDDYSVPFQNAIQTLVAYSANQVKLSSYTSLNATIKSSKRSNPRTLRNFSDLPIIHDSLVNEGVFVTLSQFVNNNPAIKDVFMTADSASTTGAVHVYRLNADSTITEITSLVALSLNGELYAYRNNRIIALERTNSSMLISRYRDPDERTNQAMYMRMVLQDSPGNANPFSKEYRCTKPGYQDVIATCIDLDTGDLSF